MFFWTANKAVLYILWMIPNIKSLTVSTVVGGRISAVVVCLVSIADGGVDARDVLLHRRPHPEPTLGQQLGAFPRRTVVVVVHSCFATRYRVSLNEARVEHM